MDEILKLLGLWIFLLLLLLALMHARATYRENALLRRLREEREQQEIDAALLADARIAGLVYRAANAPAVWRSAPKPAEVE